MADLINACLDKKGDLCLSELEEGVQFLIATLTPTVTAISKFVHALQDQHNEKLVKFFDKGDTISLGEALNGIDGSAIEEPNKEDADSLEEERELKAAFHEYYYPGKPVPTDTTLLNKKVGPTLLKRHLILSTQTKNMLQHCLHILFMDRVTDALSLSKATFHLPEKRKKELLENLKNLAKCSHDQVAPSEEDDMDIDDKDSSEEDDMNIDDKDSTDFLKMTIKEILNKYILPAMAMDESAAEMEDAKVTGEKNKEAEEKTETSVKESPWQVATKVLISIFTGLVGPDRRVRCWD